MGWIKVRIYTKLDDEELIVRNIQSNKDSYRWADSIIRSEDVQQAIEITDKSLLVYLYEEKGTLVIKDTLENFMKALNEADSFDIEFTPEEDETLTP